MTDRYDEWRDFYAEKVRSWMSLEELRAECGKLQTVDNPSPEVLLIHAMHALEECVQRDEALLREALYALEYASDMTKPEDLQGCGCPICTNITALRERLGPRYEPEPNEGSEP